MPNQAQSTSPGLKSKPVDSLTFAVDAVSDRWCLHVVRALVSGASRYTEILRIVGAPRDILASRLRKLIDTGIIEAGDAEPSSRAGYRLTAKGKDLAAVLLVLKGWGDRYRPDSVPRAELIHQTCGHHFTPEIRCAACGVALADSETVTVRAAASTT
ncbi:winged helix-turn-helix transcriptional regulator [Leifsonia sp. AG29]|uniref:winged helix-turn-helix transcriptional regulator n=1 Tax=Leifsonia sp. AG29 TaxID=2598860 RepID=UPI00131EAAC8|nr:helix-turn-helix domain-containing protein [Leifsonia sp. AG29]